MRSSTTLRSLTVSLCLALTATFGCDAEDGRDGEELSDDFEGAYYAWPLTRFGDQSRTVVAAQYLLREHGHDLELNGQFDTMTELATVSFQSSKGLADDGIIGNFTWEAMVLTVRPGDTDRWAARGVQDLLKNRYGRAIEINGNVDASTEEAIRSFQEERCLTVDGIVGMQTWNTLVADINHCSNAGRLLQLHNDGQIQLLSTDFGRDDGADPLANITDAAAGEESHRSCNFPGGGRDSRLPCGTVMLDAQLIDAMISLHDEYGFSYVVTAISGARHSTNSYHYKGRAVDIGVINGQKVAGPSTVSRNLVDACHQMGAIEPLGPHNDPNHQDHVHCAF